jgi:DNA-binding NtrC family response regulator
MGENAEGKYVRGEQRVVRYRSPGDCAMAEKLKKILVVDDDMIIVKLLETMLKVSHYQVLSAATVRSGLEKARREKPQVIVSDVRLCGETGFDLYRELQGSSETDSIPFIFISAFRKDNDSEREEIEKRARPGTIYFLEKPFDPANLVQKIEAALAANLKETRRNEKER